MKRPFLTGAMIGALTAGCFGASLGLVLARLQLRAEIRAANEAHDAALALADRNVQTSSAATETSALLLGALRGETVPITEGAVMTPAEFRKLRQRLGDALGVRMTQVRLAEELGVNSLCISQYETGGRDIPESRARLLKMLVEQAEQKKVSE